MTRRLPGYFSVSYEKIPRDEVKLPKRQKKGDYQESNHPFRFVPEVY
jgi:hypothetical protein